MIAMSRTTENVNPNDGLVLSGPLSTFHVKLRALAAESADAVYKRGTLLDLSSVDGKVVIHGTEAAEAVEAVAAQYAATSDEALVSGKTYYTKSGDVYTAVTTPDVSNIGSYYEQTVAPVAAADAEVLTANCILCDDTIVGADGDVIALAYRVGEFSRNYIQNATGSDVTITDADKEALRDVGIILSDVFAAY